MRRRWRLQQEAGIEGSAGGLRGGMRCSKEEEMYDEAARRRSARRRRQQVGAGAAVIFVQLGGDFLCDQYDYNNMSNILVMK